MVKRTDNSQLLLVATERIASMATLLGTELETVGTYTGNTHTHTHINTCIYMKECLGCVLTC